MTTIKFTPTHLVVNGKRLRVSYVTGPWVEGVDPEFAAKNYAEDCAKYNPSFKYAVMKGRKVLHRFNTVSREG